MKFGYKLFLVSFILIVSVTSLLGINLINNNFKNNIENEINKNVMEADNLVLTLTKYGYYNIDSSKYDSLKLWHGNRIIMVHSKNNTNPTDIFKNMESIIPNFDSTTDYKINVLVKNENLYIGGKVNYYKFIYEVNISDVYKTREDNTNYFIKFSLASSFLIALVLSIFIGLITRKIKILNKASLEIEKGNYNVKIKNLGNDEIGLFAKTFKSMLNAINNNIKEIETISENRKIFISNLTHEIRTPLTSIIDYSSLIKNNKVTDMDKIKNYSKRIYDEGKYIESLRDKLQNLIALDNNIIALNEENISVILIDTINNLKELYPSVLFDINVEENIIKNIDITLFKSLIINIITNSIKACDKPIIKITLNNTYLIITDNGKGIENKELEKIKEPFYTLSKDRNRENSGLGLGIPLIIKIVELHKWQYSIESKVNFGTKTIIKLEDIK